MPTGKYIRTKTLSEYLRQNSSIHESGCLIWNGSKTKFGYGTTNAHGMKTTAHRAAYIAWVGDISDDLQVDHLCRNTLCINPFHLEAVTRLENIRRGSKALKTHCKNGHEFTTENTYIKPSNGCRVCKKCNAARGREIRKLNSIKKGISHENV